MNNDELYHYGVPGMKWRRKKSKQYDTSPKIKKDSQSKTKPKLSKGKKIAIGTTAAAAALTAIGSMLVSKPVQNRIKAHTVIKALRENM